jgi:hypothetical protein
MMTGSTGAFAITPTTRLGTIGSSRLIDRPAANADDTAWFNADSAGMSERRLGHRATKASHPSRASSWWVVPTTFIAPLTNASHRKRPPRSRNRCRSTVVATGSAPLAIRVRHHGISARAAASAPARAPADQARLYFVSAPPRRPVIQASSARTGVQIGASKPSATRRPACSSAASRSVATSRLAPVPSYPSVSAHPIFAGAPTSMHKTWGFSFRKPQPSIVSASSERSYRNRVRQSPRTTSNRSG